MIVNKRAILAWAFYDWANSAYFTVILTFVFAAYFSQKIALNSILGTAQWGRAIAISGVAIAIVSPIVGAIADCKQQRKPWIFFFTGLAVIASGMLWFAKPQTDTVLFTLIWIVVGSFGVEVGMVFYNAMLKDLVPANYLGRVSGWAWGLGYAGGLVCLLIALIGFVQNHVGWLHLNVSQFEHIRIIGPFVALWFAVFSLPLFLFVPEKPAAQIGFITATQQGLRNLWQTLRHVRQYKEIIKFLIARMLYIDGVNTVFVFGGIYAAGTFGMDFSDIVQFGIAMNIAAGIGAASFAWLDDYLGSKPTILLALIIMIVMGSGMLVVKAVWAFWLLGMGLSLCVGPIQAASRSLMVRLAPAPLVTEMFGLYALSGKATAFLGPWLLSVLTLHFGSQRIGMSTIIYFLMIGFVLLWFVNVPKNEADRA